jgi:hypothetical protein
MAVKTIKTVTTTTKPIARRVGAKTPPSSGKGTKALIVIVSLLAIGGVVGYFLWKRNKDKKEQERLDAEKKKAEADALALANQNTGGNTSGGGVTGNLQVDLPTLNFQKWYNSKGYTPKLVEDGFNGAKTQSAFAKYGKEFTDSSVGTVTPSDNFNQVQSNLSVNANANGIVSVKFNGNKNVANFYNNNRVIIGTVGKSGYLKKGTYSNGGKTIVLDGGKTITSGSVWQNLNSTLS